MNDYISRAPRELRGLCYQSSIKKSGKPDFLVLATILAFKFAIPITFPESKTLFYGSSLYSQEYRFQLLVLLLRILLLPGGHPQFQVK